MASKELRKQSYEGKFFYEIVKCKNPFKVKLYGPMDDIRFAIPADGNAYQTFTFVRVIDGKIREAFTKSQILITDRKL